MAINDVLSLKAARHDAIASLNVYWGPGHQRPNFDVFIYIDYAAPLYLASISVIYLLHLAKFGWVSFAVGSASQRNRMQNYRGWVKSLVLF